MIKNRKDYFKTPAGKAAQRKYCTSVKGREVHRRFSISRLNSWIGLIPRQAKCRGCGVVISYMSGNQKTSIHFDHNNEGKEAIKVSPYTWLKRHLATPDNIVIWKSCNFGMLCQNCNKRLPTIGRVEWLRNMLEYATNGGKNDSV